MQSALPGSALPARTLPTLESMLKQAQAANSLGTLAALAPLQSLLSKQSSASSAASSTPLSAHQSLSDPSKLREMEDALSAARADLAAQTQRSVKAEAERDAAAAENSRLRQELDGMREQLQTTASNLAAKSEALQGVKKQVEASRETTAALNHSTSMWSSLFMATNPGFDATKFATLMGTTKGPAGASGDGATPGDE